MRFHEILLIPGAGWADDGGAYTRGRVVDWTSEVDVVDGYYRAIADELEDFGIRHRVLETRKSPGVWIGLRYAGIMPRTLVLDCRVGWNTARKPKCQHNISRVYYGPSEARHLADELAETVGQWGHLHCWGHKTANPERLDADPMLSPTGSWGLRLEPFELNGPNVREYAAKLSVLGRDIGRHLAQYFRTREMGITHAANKAPSKQAST